MVKRHTQVNKKHTKQVKITTILTIFLGLLIAAAIIYGVAQLITKDTTSLSIYNGFAFEKRPSGEQVYWITQVALQGEIYEVPFYHHPTELEDYVYDERITDYILRHPFQEIVIAVHPDAGSTPVLAGVNIARVTGKFYGVPTTSALYVGINETYESLGFAQVNCKDAKAIRPILWITNTTSEPSVILSDEDPYCIYVSGEGKNVLAAADLLSYKLLGIMV